jgi:hypothetical protein
MNPTFGYGLCGVLNIHPKMVDPGNRNTFRQYGRAGGQYKRKLVPEEKFLDSGGFS